LATRVTADDACLDLPHHVDGLLPVTVGEAVSCLLLLRDDHGVSLSHGPCPRPGPRVGFAAEEGVAVDLEGAGVGFPAGTPERVDGWSDLDVFEADPGERLVPALTGQPASDSTGPQVDVAHGLDRHGAAVGDVGDLQHSTWSAARGGSGRTRPACRRTG